jgi:hypothetical protein
MWKKHDLANCISIFCYTDCKWHSLFSFPYFHIDTKPDSNCAYTEQGYKWSLYVHNRDADIFAHRNPGRFSCEAVVKII